MFQQFFSFLTLLCFVWVNVAQAFWADASTEFFSSPTPSYALTGGLTAATAEALAETMVDTRSAAFQELPVAEARHQLLLAEYSTRLILGGVGLAAGMDIGRITNALEIASTTIQNNSGSVLKEMAAKEIGAGEAAHLDDGYESDTSRDLRLNRNKALKVLATREAKGERPSYHEVLNYLTSNDAYDERQQHMDSHRLSNHMLRETAHDLAENWQEYGLLAAESLPGGLGTAVSVGHQGYDVVQGSQTVGGAAGVLLTEAALAYAGGKIVKMVGKGMAKMSQRAGAYYKQTGANRMRTHADWRQPPIHRGQTIEKVRGQNLPQNFKTIDRFEWKDGVATSIKSRDLNATTYLDPKRLEARIKSDIDSLVRFERGQLNGVIIEQHQIKQKVLDIAVPHAGNATQQEVFRKMAEYAQSQNITLSIGIH